MSKLCLAVSAALVVSATPITVLAVDVPEVSGSPYPQPGEERRSLRLCDGREVPQVGRLIDDKTLEVTRDDGCSWSVATDDIYGPSLAWNNCGSGAWATGKAIDIEKDGQLWPLQVGNKVKYRFKTVNSKGKTNRNAFRNCEVKDKVMVTAAAVDYATYKVHCYEHNGTRSYYYAPSVGATVYVERERKSGPKQTMEFVKWM